MFEQLHLAVRAAEPCAALAAASSHEGHMFATVLQRAEKLEISLNLEEAI